ncbi:MAG: hypothetical protein Q8Q24_01680, partial [bacterium]|nr:hypothetical protein [bacterium]
RERVEKKSNIIAVAVRYWNCLGDVFHFDDELERKQTPFGPPGFWAGRCFRRNIPGLHVTGFYGFEGFADRSGRQIHELGDDKILFLKNRFFHMTYLARSSDDKNVMQRARKRQYRLGLPFSKGTLYPEVFWQKRPKIVPNALRCFTLQDRAKGLLFNPWVSLRTLLWKKFVYPKILQAQGKGISDEELGRLLKITD